MDTAARLIYHHHRNLLFDPIIWAMTTNVECGGKLSAKFGYLERIKLKKFKSNVQNIV
jgi:hypothetical protein